MFPRSTRLLEAHVERAAAEQESHERGELRGGRVSA